MRTGAELPLTDGIRGMMCMAAAMALLVSPAAWGQGKTPAAAKSQMSGCVTRSKAVPDALVLRSKESCSQLAGSLAKDSLVGHEVSLEGRLSVATDKMPETLQVTGVRSVGEACSATCVLEPPGKRGLRKKETPAGEGSTPGAQQPTGGGGAGAPSAPDR